MWQPIETHAGDKTPVLVSVPRLPGQTPRLAVGIWSRNWLRFEYDHWGVDAPQPTHWMPLPPPPEEPS